MILSRRRNDLVIGPPGDDGQRVVKDPLRGAYYSFGEEEIFLLDQLDGQATVESVCNAFETKFAQPVSESDITEFIALVRELHLVETVEEHQNGLAEPAGPRPRPERRRQSLLCVRVPFVDPDRLLNWLDRRIGRYWNFTGLVPSAILILTATILACESWQDLGRSIMTMPRWETVVLTWLTFLGVVTCHELAHGLTCKHYGGKVNDMGMLLLFWMPCLYCNVSDSWLFPERWKRIVVMLAGSYFELVLWSFAVFFWRWTIPGILFHSLSVAIVALSGARVLFNFNPLIKLDGYYILSDYLKIPNLRERGLATLMARLRWLLWGARKPEPEPRAGVLLVYGISSLLFSLGLVSLLILGLIQWASGFWGVLGFALAAFLAYATVRPLFQGFFGKELTNMINHRHKRTAVWVCGLGFMPAVLFLGQVKDWVGGPCHVRSQSQAEINSPIGGFLKEVFHEEGDQVDPGEQLVRIEMPDLFSKLSKARAGIREGEAELKLLEVGPRPEKVREQRLKVERAKRWRDDAQKDLERAQEAMKHELAEKEAKLIEQQNDLETAEDALNRSAKLYKKGQMPPEEYNKSKNTFEAAQSRLAQTEASRRAIKAQRTVEAEEELGRRKNELSEAESELALLEAGTRPEEIEAKKAHLASLEAELRYLEDLRVKTLVKSPTKGRVTTTHLREKVGHFYQQGELICEVKSVATLEAEVDVSEQMASRLRSGQKVMIKFRALPFRKFTAQVDQVSAIAELTKQGTLTPNAPIGETPSTVKVKCRLVDPNHLLRPGMTGYAHIDSGRRAIGSLIGERFIQLLRTEYWW